METTTMINIEEHFGLVCSVVQRYVPKNMPIEDSEEYADGLIGLLRAVREFEPEKHFKFSTFATWCIQNAVTQGWRKKNRKRRTAVVTSLEEKEIDLTDHKKDYDKVLKLISEFMKPHPDDVESDTRRKYVLSEHFLNDRTWQDIAEELNITRSRCQQLGNEAIRTIQKRFNLEDENLENFLEAM